MSYSSLTPMPTGKQGSKRKDLTELEYKSDVTITFRVSADIKEEFTKLCQTQHMPVSRALKRYMTRAIQVGNLGVY